MKDWMLLANNQTSVENHKFGFYKEKVWKESKKKITFPYDLGWLRNMKSILGENILDWFLPTPTNVGDGLYYPMSSTYAVDLENQSQVGQQCYYLNQCKSITFVCFSFF